jgi:thiosulfate dehydrogenase
MQAVLSSRYFLLLLSIAVAIVMGEEFVGAVTTHMHAQATHITDTAWHAPSLLLDNEPAGRERALVIYGEELITNTSRYFGPHGKIQKTANGMNCQNCHLSAGTRPWGNSFFLVYSRYPVFRPRSGSVENVYKRVSDCFERSLNGHAIDSNSKEFMAMRSYINWVGKDVKKDQKPTGASIEKLPFLDRAADPAKGKIMFQSKCSSCHGANGAGVLSISGDVYTYPPLWGPDSYNDGAGLFRISTFASFIKYNMPYGQTSHESPLLSDEEAWDLAAFVNSQPRPHKDQSADWHKLDSKPVDFPFGPYADNFSEQQHKYGPFKPIAALKK